MKHFFEDVPLLSVSRNSLLTPSLDDICFRNFTFSNSIILMEDLIRWNRVFKYFWLTTMPVILELKISLKSIKKFLYKCHSPCARWLSWHSMLYLYFLGSYNICYLSACNRDLFKSYYCYSKNHSNIMKNISNSISTYSWKQIVVGK